VITTRAPAAAQRRAMASPTPRVDPVTNMTSPSEKLTIGQ
jgi:hypothetical protein